MTEFTMGMKFQFYYWRDSYAVCLNTAFFITPTDYNVVSATKLEKCDKVLVKCLDNWDTWTDTDELLIGTCTLSSSEDITVYQYKPFENEYTRYLVGNDTYLENYCWPGPTPLYSWFLKYPNNPLYSLLWSWLDLNMSFKTAYEGLPSNNRAFEAPTGQKGFLGVFGEMVDTWKRDLVNYATPNPDGTIDLTVDS